MLTELTFSMDGTSSAPTRVGTLLVPYAASFTPQWLDRDARTYVTMVVPAAQAARLARLLPAAHPSVRCIDRHELVVDEAV